MRSYKFCKPLDVSGVTTCAIGLLGQSEMSALHSDGAMRLTLGGKYSKDQKTRPSRFAASSFSVTFIAVDRSMGCSSGRERVVEW